MKTKNVTNCKLLSQLSPAILNVH